MLSRDGRGLAPMRSDGECGELRGYAKRFDYLSQLDPMFTGIQNPAADTARLSGARQLTVTSSPSLFRVNSTSRARSSSNSERRSSRSRSAARGRLGDEQGEAAATGTEQLHPPVVGPGACDEPVHVRVARALVDQDVLPEGGIQ